MSRPLLTLKPRVGKATLTHASACGSAVHGTGSRIRGRVLQVRNSRLLAQHPLCVECEKVGIVRAATQQDHIIPLHLGGADDESNLQGLCDACHLLKSAQEARQRSGR